MNTWWKNPFRFLDVEDFHLGEEHAEVLARMAARVAFKDMIVNRSVEGRVLFDLFMRALGNLDTSQFDLTARQQAAVNHAISAVQMGVNPAKHVAQQLGITVRAAYYMLNRADVKLKMFNFGELVHDIDSVENDVMWQPTRNQVRSKMAHLPRRCAAHGSTDCKGTTGGTFALCYSCYQKYGIRGEWPEWLYTEANALETEHRELAINELYREHRRNRPETHEQDYSDYAEAM